MLWRPTGRAGAELLLEEATAAARHEHQQLVFEPELVVRESSRHKRRVVAGSRHTA